jgi:hypothetical protein
VAAKEPEFSGTFAGETTPVTAKAAASSPLIRPDHAAALSKYEIDPNKPVRPKKVRRPPSFLRIVLVVCSCMVVCLVAGLLLIGLSPFHSVTAGVGRILLLAAAMFVFSLLLVVGRRRR